MFRYLLVLLLPLYLFSQPNYNCKIEKVSKGNLKSYLNESFHVNRKTGLMTGALKNSFLTKPKIIDMGSNSNSYKVVTTMKLNQGVGIGTNIHVLVIEEFNKSKEKPFVYLWNSNIYQGKCVHN